jgi:hypothetical protein
VTNCDAPRAFTPRQAKSEAPGIAEEIRNRQATRNAARSLVTCDTQLDRPTPRTFYGSKFPPTVTEQLIECEPLPDERIRGADRLAGRTLDPRVKRPIQTQEVTRACVSCLASGNKERHSTVAEAALRLYPAPVDAHFDYRPVS